MMIFFENYEVELFKKTDGIYQGNIAFIDRKNRKTKYLHCVCIIDWDDENKLELNFIDNSGNIRFINYPPSSLKDMFDFIGKGYGIFDDGFGT